MLTMRLRMTPQANSMEEKLLNIFLRSLRLILNSSPLGFALVTLKSLSSETLTNSFQFSQFLRLSLMLTSIV